MTKVEIKLGYCIAYDWEMLKISIPLTYPFVDTICLSIDEDKLSWANEPYYFDQEDFDSFITKIDVERKIQIYKDNFHTDPSNSMKNEVIQRNKMAAFMGNDFGWHMQLDVDEYPCNMKSISSFLRKSYHKFTYDVNICIPFITLFKKIDEGFLITSSSKEWMQIATKRPKYEFGRRNGFFNYLLDSPVLHQSWARKENEVKKKITNWGHKDDFDTSEYFDFWKNININNYKQIRNFHPENPKVWKSLILLRGQEISDLLNNEKQLRTLKSHGKFELLIKNSRNISRIRSLMSKLKTSLRLF